MRHKKNTESAIKTDDLLASSEDQDLELNNFEEEEEEEYSIIILFFGICLCRFC
jgi:hypothetical protein